jgi:hypothetical protein
VTLTRKKLPPKRAKRKPRPALVQRDPEPREMAQAARRLHEHLSWIVERLDRCHPADRREPKAWTPEEQRRRIEREADWWQGYRATERPPTRASLDKVPGHIQAIRLVAERTVIDGKREVLGILLASRARAVARSKLRPVTAIEQARGLRGDGGPGETALQELKGALGKARSVRARFAAAYAVLAAGADVWPAPDTRSGLRGELRKLFEGLSKPVKVVSPEEYEAFHVKPNRD